MFQFSCRFAFSSTFRLSNRTPKITRILTLHQANAPTLAPFSKEDKILIHSLYEYKGYKPRQFIAEFPDKIRTKKLEELDQKAAAEVEKRRHVDA